MSKKIDPVVKRIFFERYAREGETFEQALERMQKVWKKTFAIAEAYGYKYGGTHIGAMTSKEPNIQNLPRKVGAHPAFGAPYGQGAKFFNVDYSELEPRIFSLPNHGGWKQYPNETHCPKCQVAWVKTEGFNRVYEDCPKCGGKKEDAR